MGALGPRPRLAILAALALAAAGCTAPRAGGEAGNTVRAILFHDPASLTFIGNPDYNSEVLSKLVTRSSSTTRAWSCGHASRSPGTCRRTGSR
jgi:hypothetical protein